MMASGSSSPGSLADLINNRHFLCVWILFYFVSLSASSLISSRLSCTLWSHGPRSFHSFTLFLFLPSPYRRVREMNFIGVIKERFECATCVRVECFFLEFFADWKQFLKESKVGLKFSYQSTFLRVQSWTRVPL